MSVAHFLQRTQGQRSEEAASLSRKRKRPPIERRALESLGVHHRHRKQPDSLPVPKFCKSRMRSSIDVTRVHECEQSVTGSLGSCHICIAIKSIFGVDSGSTELGFGGAVIFEDNGVCMPAVDLMGSVGFCLASAFERDGSRPVRSLPGSAFVFSPHSRCCCNRYFRCTRYLPC